MPCCCCLIALALFAEGRPDAGTRAYAAMAKEHAAALAAFQRAFSLARTAKEREAAFKNKHPRNSEFAPRFLAVARDHPRSLAAVDALEWVVLHPVEKTLPESALRGQALSKLLRLHADDVRLGVLCTRLVLTVDSESEEFLAALARKTKDKATLARARASRAHNLKARAAAIRHLKEDKPAAAEYERLWGKEAVALLLRRDPDKLEKQSAALFETVARKHGTLSHPTHGTLAKMAKAHLAALRQPVAVDKPAPEIEGTDLAGKALKLSDFKGKVVLLDFHAHAFAPCRAMFPAEAALVEKMAGKPFVLLGVNGDASRPEARRKGKAARASWRSWWDGGGLDGPIATRWEVDQWPTVALIDKKGVVRQIWTGWPMAKELEAAIAGLVGKAG